MPFVVYTPTALHNEILADPAQLGLVALYSTGSDGAVADRLNAGASGVGGGPAGETLIVPAVPTGTAIAFLVHTDFQNLAAWQQAYMQTLAASQTLVLKNPEAPDQSTPAFLALQALFPSTTQSGQNLAALSSRPCSRAEFLFGPGTIIQASDVAAARKA